MEKKKSLIISFYSFHSPGLISFYFHLLYASRNVLTFTNVSYSNGWFLVPLRFLPSFNGYSSISQAHLPFLIL